MKLFFFSSFNSTFSESRKALDIHCLALQQGGTDMKEGNNVSKHALF